MNAIAPETVENLLNDFATPTQRAMIEERGNKCLITGIVVHGLGSRPDLRGAITVKRKGRAPYTVYPYIDQPT